MQSVLFLTTFSKILVSDITYKKIDGRKSRSYRLLGQELVFVLLMRSIFLHLEVEILITANFKI